MQSRNQGLKKTRLHQQFKKAWSDSDTSDSPEDIESSDEISSEAGSRDGSDADSDCSGHIGIEDECSVEEELFKSEDESGSDWDKNFNDWCNESG